MEKERNAGILWCRVCLKIFIILWIVVIFVIARKDTVNANVTSSYGELVYKSNGNYYKVNTLGNTAYANISRNSDFYLKYAIDCELIAGSTLKTYVTSGSSGVFTTSTFYCQNSDEDYYYDSKSYCAYIPISSALKYQQGSVRLYYEMVLANGQVMEACDKFSTNAYYLNLLGEYTVSYNANGGNDAPASQTKYSESALFLSNLEPVRTGYTFNGWSESSAAETVSYQSGDKYTLNRDITLYAHWTANNYTVYFNGNGGNTNTASKTVTYNSNYGTLPTPTRMGYTFAGWYTSADGGKEILESSLVSSGKDHTLYAHWTKKEVYTITFQANGGTVGIKNKTVTAGDAYGTLPTPTRTGYTFVGWYTKKSGGNVVNKNTCMTEGKNQTLYAHWTANKYKVTFQANGGKTSVKSKNVTYAGTYGTLPQPTRSGYTFTGWYTAKSGGKKITATTKVTITANQTLYAVWKVNAPTTTKVTVKLTASNSVKISWKKVTGASGYTVYRATKRNGSYKAVKTVKGSTLSITDAGLKAGKTYYYKVAAYKTAGSKKIYGNKSAAKGKKILGRLDTPTQNIINLDKVAQTFTISWNPVKNAQNIIIYRKIGNGSYKKWKTVPVKNGSVTYSYADYQRGRTYTFMLRASYSVDEITVYSSDSRAYNLNL